MHPELAMPKYGKLDFQQSTGQREYPRYSVDIYSPELPCGAAWLASCFLELGAPIWRFWNVDNDTEWRALGGRRYRYESRFSPWSRVIPGLLDGREFDFRDSPVARFTHEQTGAWTEATRLVIFVREPRDALYSQWRRESAITTSRTFRDWLSSADSRWQLPRLEAYAMDIATRICAAMLSNRSFRIVRFEDTKRDALDVLETLWRYVAPSSPVPEAAALSTALQRSDFAVVRAVEDRLLNSRVLSNRINFRGRAFEYKEREDHSESMFAAVHGDIFALLGYEPFQVGAMATSPPTDAPPWLMAPGRKVTTSLVEAIRLAERWVYLGLRPMDKLPV